MQSDHALSDCQGKASHSPRRAREIANEMRKRVQAYHCPHCNGWHVGSGNGMPNWRRA